MVRAVKKAGGVVLKLPASWYIGIPDRLLLLPGGKVFFIELKKEKEKPGKFQLWWQNKLKSLGFFAEVLAGREQVNQFIQRHIQVNDAIYENDSG